MCSTTSHFTYYSDVSQLSRRSRSAIQFQEERSHLPRSPGGWRMEGEKKERSLVGWRLPHIGNCAVLSPFISRVRLLLSFLSNLMWNTNYSTFSLCLNTSGWRLCCLVLVFCSQTLVIIVLACTARFARMTESFMSRIQHRKVSACFLRCPPCLACVSVARVPVSVT